MTAFRMAARGSGGPGLAGGNAGGRDALDSPADVRMYDRFISC